MPTPAELDNLSSSIRYHARMVAFPKFRSSRDLLIVKAHNDGMPVWRIALSAMLSEGRVRSIIRASKERA